MIPNHRLSLDDRTESGRDATTDIESRPDKQEEACGVFGIFAPEEDVAKLTYFGLYAL